MDTICSYYNSFRVPTGNMNCSGCTELTKFCTQTLLPYTKAQKLFNADLMGKVENMSETTNGRFSYSYNIVLSIYSKKYTLLSNGYYRIFSYFLLDV